MSNEIRSSRPPEIPPGAQHPPTAAMDGGHGTDASQDQSRKNPSGTSETPAGNDSGNRPRESNPPHHNIAETQQHDNAPDPLRTTEDTKSTIGSNQIPVGVLSGSGGDAERRTQDAPSDHATTAPKPNNTNFLIAYLATQDSKTKRATPIDASAGAAAAPAKLADGSPTVEPTAYTFGTDKDAAAPGKDLTSTVGWKEGNAEVQVHVGARQWEPTDDGNDTTIHFDNDRITGRPKHPTTREQNRPQGSTDKTATDKAAANADHKSTATLDKEHNKAPENISPRSPERQKADAEHTRRELNKQLMQAGIVPLQSSDYQPTAFEKRVTDGDLKGVYRPVYDKDTGDVAAYSYQSKGFSKIVDRNGAQLSSGEIGIEHPLVDPLDVIGPGEAAFIGKVAVKAGGLVARGIAGLGREAVSKTAEIIAKRGAQESVKEGAEKVTKAAVEAVGLWERNKAGEQLSKVAEEALSAAIRDGRPPLAAKDLGQIGITSRADTFRRELIKIISSQKEPPHPLHFLLKDGKLEQSTARGMNKTVWRESPTIIEAGHTASAKSLPIGERGDHFMVMSAHHNRYLAGTVEHPSKRSWAEHIALVIGGVPVHPETAADWVAANLLRPELLASARKIVF